MWVKIPLTRGYETVIDAIDYPTIKRFKWFTVGGGKCKLYAMTRLPNSGSPGTFEYLHRMILQPPPGMQIDHRNGNGLDNSRKNLRLCTAQQNSWNRRVKKNGVRKLGNWWYALTRIEGKQKTLGKFRTQKEAVQCRKDFVKTQQGEFYYGRRMSPRVSSTTANSYTNGDNSR